MDIQEFNEQKKLYQVLFNFLKKKGIGFLEIDPNNISKTLTKKFIQRGEVSVNSIKTIDASQSIHHNSMIHVASLDVEFICLQNSKINDSISSEDFEISVSKVQKKVISVSKVQKKVDSSVLDSNGKVESDIDLFILDFLRTNLDCSSIDEIRSIDSKKAFCYIINLFELKGFEEIKKSESSYELTDIIKEVFISSKLAKELDFPKNQLAFTGKIIDSIIREKKNKEIELMTITHELKAGLYDRNAYRFLQTYSKIISSVAFQYIIAPDLENTLHSRVAIENLIKPINEAYLKIENEAKYLYFDNCGCTTKFPFSLNYATF